MARPLRIEYPGAVYHVTTRGNAGQGIFIDDEDRRLFLDTYAEVSARMQWRCLAYCLLDDHYQLVIETPKANLAKGMRQLNGVYTQRFNQRHGRSGHLFQGRYKAVLVERNQYLRDTCRYVVLTPVRTGLARKPGSWKWSSYRATAGIEQPPPWLNTDGLLNQFAQQRKRAQRAYEDFAQKGKQVDIWDDLKHQIYLGSDSFIKRMQAKPKTTIRGKRRVASRQRLDKQQALTRMKKRIRDPKRAMAQAYLSGHYTLNEVAKKFGVHYSTVSRAVKDYENRD